MGQAQARSRGERDPPTAMPSAGSAVPSALLLFGSGNPLLRGRLVHCRLYTSSILGLHPLDANGTLFRQF